MQHITNRKEDGRTVWLLSALMALAVVSSAGLAAVQDRGDEAVSSALATVRDGGHGSMKMLNRQPWTPEAVADLSKQTLEQADIKSKGCVSCHQGSEKMHASKSVKLGCTDCHGGDPTTRVERLAHVQPRFPEEWKTSANPEQSYTLLNKESPEFIQFMNPSDLRVAPKTCGTANCHEEIVMKVSKSMMTLTPMLWGAALYNNGAYPYKVYRFGESYGADGTPRMVLQNPAPSEADLERGVLPYVTPLPRWEITQSGNILRAFERGGLIAPEIGLPIRETAPGRPDIKLSFRGQGTLLSTDPVILNLQKTRLNDPNLSWMGTNDHAGDYRQSGCAGCHVPYANDRDPIHSGPWAKYGKEGKTATADQEIDKEESGHPIKHQFTRAIPSSQCMVCHMHQGNAFLNSYLGYTWWDQETDGEHMYPKEQIDPDSRRTADVNRHNPNGAAVRGLWGDREFLKTVSELNSKLQRTQFADYNGHGWIFRAAYKQDRKGNLLDGEGKQVPHDDPEKFKKAVHLRDIHAEKGMHCVDCHFEKDSHGDGNIYGEIGNATELDCIDCHGTIQNKATLITSGAAAGEGTNLAALRTPSGKRRFQERGGKLLQRSMVDPGLEWEVVQTKDTIDPASEHFSELSRLAKTIQKDGKTWGQAPEDEKFLAHANEKMTCYACHSSWVTACFGCHLPMKANNLRKMLKNEGDKTRNYTTYNPQVVRDAEYMLGVNGTVKGNRVAPVRSSSAVIVGSVNANRESIYSQQQTVAGNGMSGQAFNTHVPHTVRGKETKSCTECHVSDRKDNNAWMAQTLLLGTNSVNFMGRYIYVAEEDKGFEAVVVTEREEPQAVIGSYLQSLAYPRNFEEHQKSHGELDEAHHHHGKKLLSLQLRGEYLYTARGKNGFEVYDVANVDNKGFSERLVTAPVSPLGQRAYVGTKDARFVALPSTLALDPGRPQFPQNQEQPIHPLYAYAYIADFEEGLILVNTAPLGDGDPDNNFLRKAVEFNPGGLLDGAVGVTIAGTHAYVSCARGVVVVDIDDPLNPKTAAVIGEPHVRKPRRVDIQFRYAFVCDEAGVRVLDVTDPANPLPLPKATVRMPYAHNIYLAKTRAYVAGGSQGLVILDIERPERPFVEQIFNDGGKLDDVRDVKVAMTNASLFAYVADGKNGLKVLQLTSPKKTPGNFGFSPDVSPEVIATYHTHGPAVALSKGLDRDRAVDESGNQIAIFGRLGSRPFTRAEMERLYRHADGTLYTVSDSPPTKPVDPPKVEEPEEKKEEKKSKRTRGRRRRR